MNPEEKNPDPELIEFFKIKRQLELKGYLADLHKYHMKEIDWVAVKLGDFDLINRLVKHGYLYDADTMRNVIKSNCTLRMVMYLHEIGCPCINSKILYGNRYKCDQLREKLNFDKCVCAKFIICRPI